MILKDYLQLSKIRIMIPVALTGFTGYFLYKPLINAEILLVSFGILLLAISSSILNQIQEVSIDRKMLRTQNRPLPEGRITVRVAMILFALNLLCGSALVFFYGTLTAALTGLFTIFWYNGIYTYSKRISSFAVFPGSLTGAIPPLIGWTAAGGNLFDKPIIFVAFLLFMGQVPHFWLLILKYGKEYSNAGLPSLTNALSPQQINRLSFTWIVASAIAAMFLPYFEVIQSGFITFLILLSSFLLIWSFRGMINGPIEQTPSRRNFILLNSYFLLILIFLVVDRIFH